MNASGLQSPDHVAVYLVRHGQTAWNVERRFLGRTDLPLDAVGRDQAARVGAVLRGIGPTAVYTSPLLRARETAEAIGPAVADPGFAEMDMGALEGLSGPECLARHPGVLERWRDDPAATEIPGGETLAEVQARILAAFRARMAHHAHGDRVVLVTHQLALASLLCGLLDRPLSAFRGFGHRNGAFTELGVGRAVVLVRLDEGAHLPG